MVYATFRDNLSVPSSRIKLLSLTLEDGTVSYVTSQRSADVSQVSEITVNFKR
jgi:hypothetical protein